jgi:hypothetical protein
MKRKRKHHNNFFSILDMPVTNRQVVRAGYRKGIVRRKLDGSQVLVQGRDRLPVSLNEFASVKNQTLDEILPILKGTEWSDMRVGI